MRQADAVARFATAIWTTQSQLYYLTATSANETDRKKIQDLAQRALQTASAVQQALHAVRALSGAMDRVVEIVNSLEADVAAYLKQAKNVASMADRDAGSALMFMMGAERSFAKIVSLVDELVQTSNAARDAEIAAANARLGNQVTLLAVTAAAAVLVGCLISLLVGAGIAKPVVALAAAIERIASGTLDTPVPGEGRRDEIGAIAAAVRVFKERLIERNRLEREAADLHKSSAEKLRATEAAFATAARSQTEVVEKLRVALDALARGDLTTRVAGEVASDYEKLKRDLNQAVASLEKTITAVAITTESIHGQSAGIAHACDDLSLRTEQQASNLEETTGARAEINQTVHKTAQGTRQASAVVQAAKTEAKTSSGVMREAVVAMANIQKSSRQIGEIIAVIDDIAFQTNLLALNAGVEAARAGDAGRGFAVVAFEVRALAQRAAAAAKEIEVLILDSTKQVESGVGLVGRTEKALERIVLKVNEVNGLVAEFAGSAQQQAAALSSVHGAVSQLDQVTRQNAAMAQESTAAAHSLQREMTELPHRLRQFRIKLEADPLGPAATGMRGAPRYEAA
jgi:methyl-accepting chemotaxis protein